MYVCMDWLMYVGYPKSIQSRASIEYSSEKLPSTYKMMEPIKGR